MVEPSSNGNGPIAAKSIKGKSEAEKRKERKKRAKENRRERWTQQAEKQKSAASNSDVKPDDDEEEIVIEYVSAPVPELEEAAAVEDEEGEGRGGLGAGGLGFTKAEPSSNGLEELRKVFESFGKVEELLGTAPAGSDEEEEAGTREEKGKEKEEASSSDSDDEEGEGGKGTMSKKQLKALNRMKIAELKQTCERPEVVEVWDVTSADPPLLVFLKAYRNTVAVPRHWSQKRKYLQGKRGLEKPPFQLPDFIEKTGITEMRKAYQEKENEKKMKQKQRDRMAPRMGKLDIDYQVLHDAFFKHQRPPKLEPKGELYYEGKEYEARVEGIRPGLLSEDLRRALGMNEVSPPPWLINMQRYGPPPSYPNLKIPGLNAPIPPGCQFGYQVGGWGKPPVDEDGNPLYGDVFAQNANDADSDEEVDKVTRWGAMELEVEESSEEEEDEDEDEEDNGSLADGIASGLASGMVSGLTAGTMSSLPSGLETPDTSINLRKAVESEQPRQLYQVLEQRAAPATAATLLGTDHVYVIPGTQTQGGTSTVDGGKKGKNKLPSVLQAMNVTDVEVTLTPEEVEGLDENALKALWEARVAEARAANRREDFSELVAQKAAQQKRKAQQRADDKDGKKQKGFKF